MEGIRMIEVQGLTKRYGSKVAVDDISFTAVSYTHLTLPTNSRV